MAHVVAGSPSTEKDTILLNTKPNIGIEADPDYLNLTSGYIKRSLNIFPKQGKKAPWRNNQNYLIDIFQMKYGRIDDGEISFEKII